MIHVNIYEAKARLSALIRRVKAGDTIVLCERNRPVAELRAIRAGGKPGERRLGQMPGSAPVDDRFFAGDAGIADEFNKAKITARKRP